MKRILFTLILGLATHMLFAEGNRADTSKKDSIKTKKGAIIKFGYGDDASQININRNEDTTVHHNSAYPHFSFGITIARLDLGLATLMDNGSFTLKPQNQFLRYRSWKTSNAGFDVFQFGARFSDSFKLYLAAGFDWTNIRLRDDITILPHQPSLSYVTSNLTLSKNRFTSSYLRLPLSFDFRTKEDADGNRFHFVIGPEAGFLLTASVKQVSTEDGTKKVNDTYNYATFRYGAVARIGYGAWGIYAKYYFNNMFENSPDQNGLHDFAFGIMLGF
ncbi:outer membrane protein with beta-barrel domain [Mucilaginibacter frigoritolerans]|uniref:Outer membrane protein with beta-barrel domain n=1 Tax=Mucilaginibacter frigoritolerans TaxID=652788 RepID=A0A562U0T9_9SPHI|nr:outer membrane beta-barrel protein [Mucilaginibacter frigoritolerans]TWI99303.1 outer membrane protein with beta-barrel domain [Mucilaginibacter frigoritolerans]